MYLIIFIFAFLFFYNGTPLSAQDIDSLSYYPLAIGNQWDYSSQSFHRTEKIIDTTRINGHLYYGLSTWSDQVAYWMREEGNILYLLNSNDSTEILLFDFNADTGKVWKLPTRYNCSFGNEITLISKDNTIITPTETFLNCYHFKHKPICFDAGIFDTWFSKGVGKVRWIEDNISGSLLFDLNSNKIISTIETDKNILSTEYYKLSQNYPNPFNPNTVISWQLAIGSHVELSIYNILGQKIETLLNKPMPAGHHEVEFNGQNLSSGIYLYRIEAREWQDVKKMVLLQ